jgi:small-conductance mechanosensitive channel
MSSKKATMFREAMREFWDSIPKLVVNLGTAYLIYLFGMNAFIPLADSLGLTIGGLAVSQVTSVVVLCAMALLVYRSLGELHDIAEALAKFLAVQVGEDVTDEEVEDYRTAIRGLITVGAIVVALYFFLGMLREINVVVAGVVYIFAVLYCIMLLLRTGSALEREIGAWAEEKARRLDTK